MTAKMKSVCRSGTKSSRVCVASSPRPVFSPGPMAMTAWLLLIARAAGVVARVQERGEASALVAREGPGPHGGGHDERKRSKATRVAPIATKWVHGTPPMNIAARWPTPNTSDVPRSGCRKTRAAGASPRQRSGAPCCPGRAAPGAIDDEAGEGRTSRTLPSSEGWKRKKGNSKARREPRAATPKTKTNATLAHEQRVDPDPQLAEARVVDATAKIPTSPTTP